MTLSQKYPKQLETLKSQIESDSSSKIELLITELEEAIQKEDYTSMKEKRDTLQAELISVGEKVYKQNENADGSINTDSVETDFSTEK